MKFFIMEWPWTIVLVVCLAVYLLFTSLRDPLRSVPGPFLARITGAWLVLIELRGQRSTVLHRLHQKYGPVVRISPQQLSFSSPEALRDIYGPGNKYAKAPAYAAFGRKSLFTMLNKDEHRARAKRIAHIFAPTSVAQIEPIVHSQVSELVTSLDKRIGQPVDVLHWFRMLALDVIGDIFLGKTFGGLETEEEPQIMRDIDVVFPSYWVEYQFPWLQALLLRFPYRPLQKFLEAGNNFYQYGADAFNDYIDRYGRTGDRVDLLTKMIKESKGSTSSSSSSQAPLTDQEIIIEITNLTFAGIDTTGNTFSYLFWELAKNPVWQRRLREELSEIDFAAGIPRYKDIAKLPVLEAVIQETLRLHPASPASLPRVPTREGETISGVKIPVNTVVSCQSYTTQRDPSTFREPDQFLPERWIDAKQELADAMHELILVWGKGTRACLGKPIAMMELKLGTAALVKKFSVALDNEKTNEDMEMTDHFVLIPKGGKCMLRLERVQGHL